jgi:hypothetical protein
MRILSNLPVVLPERWVLAKGGAQRPIRGRGRNDAWMRGHQDTP